MVALNAQSIAQTTPTGNAIAQAVISGWALDLPRREGLTAAVNSTPATA
jgi:hypothetical protein